MKTRRVSWSAAALIQARLCRAGHLHDNTLQTRQALAHRAVALARAAGSYRVRAGHVHAACVQMGGPMMAGGSRPCEVNNGDTSV